MFTELVCFCLNKLTSKHGKRITLFFQINCINIEECRSHGFLICFEKELRTLSSISSTACYLCSFYLQIYLLNACKLDREENLFEFNVKSIAFRIKVLTNLTLI